MLRNAGLTLKPKKCHLLKTQVFYLGYMVSGEAIATNPDKIWALKEWGPPEDLSDVRRFLGLCSYYRRFITEFSAHAKPLTKLTEENQEVKWDFEQEKAWCELKHWLTNSPILAYHDPKLEFIHDTDASSYGIELCYTRSRMARSE